MDEVRRHHLRGAHAAAPPHGTRLTEVPSTKVYGTYPHSWHTTHGQQPWGSLDLGGSLQDNPGCSVVTEHLPTSSPEIWDEDV